MSKSITRILQILALLIPHAASPAGEPVAEQTAESTPQTATPADLQWFTEARFGMFIHWGPVSLKGTEIGWSRGAQVPTEEYDLLYEQFNPTSFDAAEWVDVAAAAGMRYIVLTSKHHDGFCLWPSAFTDYDIASTHFKRDILSELADACRERDIRFCLYHSICDWHHPDYPTDSPGGRGVKPDPDMDRYVQYLHNQLDELLTFYGPLGILWFDGEWEKPWTVEHGEDLYRFLKDRQPDIIINNRVGKARQGMAGTTRQDLGNPGDYDTPEQEIGSFKRDRPWETCMTICRQWAWKPADEMKSLKECLRTLIQAAGGDGNLLFNVGPMPDGRIEPRQVERLREMGDWLRQYGQGIYGTRGGPYKPGPWGASTCRDNEIYLFIMSWPEDGPLMLPAFDSQIIRCEALSGGKVSHRQTDDVITLRMAQADRRDIATVIKLNVNGRAFDIPPVDVPLPPSGSVAVGGKATASNTFRNMAEYGPDKAFDDDLESRWATDADAHTAWLEVEFDQPKAVRRAIIIEGEWDRVRSYELQVDNNGTWETLLSGNRRGPRADLRFLPVETRRLRLNILHATEGPTLWEFHLFES